MRFLFLFVALSSFITPAYAAFDSADAAGIKNLEILRVTPDGEDVPAGSQIVIQFNRPVVPIGNMERPSSEIPVIITPALPCEWRWINSSALACNLPDKDALKESTHYTLDIKPGIKTEDGVTIANTYHHSFITMRPAIKYKEFNQWKAPGYPVVRLVFNQAVSQESVAQHVFMIIDNEQKKRIALTVRPDHDSHDTPQLIPVPGEKYSLWFKKMLPKKSDDNLHKTPTMEARRIWLIEPQRKLPLDTHIILKTEPGLVSATGPEKSVASSDIVEFDTYPKFEFLGIKCTNNKGDQIDIAAGQLPTDKCNPMRSVALSFSAPVESERMRKMVKFTPPMGIISDDEVQETTDGEGTDDGEDRGLGYEFRRPHEKGETYQMWFSGGLKAASEYSVESRSLSLSIFTRTWHKIKAWFSHSTNPIDVQDMFGRELQTPISAHFSSDHRIPNFVLNYRDVVLEKGVDSEIPFFVNNITSYDFNYTKLTSEGSQTSQVFKKNIPLVKDIQFAVPFGVREMLNGKTGAVFGTLATNPMVSRDRDGGIPPQLFAEVTPFQVHLKFGHFNSIAWVTDMSTGAPVSGAHVSLYQDTFEALSAVKEPETEAITDSSGVALLPGTEMLDPDLVITRDYYAQHDKDFFLRVDKGDDMALLPVTHSFIIDSYRSSGGDMVYPDNRQRYGHMKAWGITAQGVYRAGDTIQYKIFVRNQDNNGFIPAPNKNYHLKVIDPTGKTVQNVKNLTLSEFGGISGEFTVSKEAAVGWYKFKLVADFTPGQANDDTADNDSEENNDDNGRDSTKSWIPMQVLVSDFTPVPFKVSNQLSGDLFNRNQQVNVISHAELHAGGAYTDAAARVTAILESEAFISPYPLTKDFTFDSYKNENPSQQIFQKIDKVDNKGELSLNFSTGAPQVVYGKLMVESAVADDRGKYISTQAHADYIGVDRLVGLALKDWLFKVGTATEIDYVVVDEHGVPAKGTTVDIVIQHMVTKAARVKSVGSAYLTEYHTEWETAGNCHGISTDAPLSCSFTPQKSGAYRAIANIVDTVGTPHTTSLSSYAIGSDYVAWDDENENSLTILPEKTTYKVGDTAHYLVKNPYPGAKALVTVERYGVIDRFVQDFTSSTPVINLKIKPEYMPGFYLSVVVMSPRVDKPLDKDQVDLGKPTFRMGYVKVPVKDPYKEMLITAKTDREIYKPRDKVMVKLHAEPRVKDKKEPVELTVVVLDEAVFDLITGGKSYFDPYEGFYKLDNLDLRNYSLLTRLIGRQKFEKKGANPGGDGGSDLSIRSLFKFISYWNADLKTDKNGDAKISFEAPDNLTGWRILAIATTPTDRFGLNDANFKVNRPTEVRPVMPNQVMEGDQFDAGFSVMNRTDKARTIKVMIHAEGNIDSTKTPADMTKVVTLESYKRTTVLMPIKTTQVEEKRDVKAGSINFTATAGDDFDQDGMVQSVPVNKRRSLDVAANYGTTTKDHIEEPILFPEHILPDIGSVSIVASPTVIGNISGAFSYMHDYPYTCWEQKLSKGVMASHYRNLKAYLPDSIKWQGSDTLPQETLNEAAGFQAPNGGMTYFRSEDDYVDPYLSAYTAISFNWLRKSGYTVPEQVENKLQSYLSNLLKNNIAPTFYSEGMTSTVRAVALAVLAERGKADLSDLERYQPYVKDMSLFGKSYFLQAALAINGGEKYAPDVAKMILAMSNETGGKFVFNESWDDSYTRILASPMRENCAVLDAFVLYGERDGGKELVGDVPFKLMRAITQDRKQKDYWQNTQENMFCMNALIDFSRVYEKDKPAMTVTATMDNVPMGSANFTDFRDPAATIERPIKEGDAGRKTSVMIDKVGSGRVYYATRLAYALPAELSKPANAGIEIHREYSVERDKKWLLLASPAQIKRGELVRVDLYLSVPAARNFVVVDDPVPGGVEPVNRDLANSSEVDAKKGDFEAAGGAFWFKFTDWIDFGISHWDFYHQEIRHDSVRFYSDYLPAGNYHLSYAAQAIATGSFSALPAMAQEMYDPDVYGKTEGLVLDVSEQEAAPPAAH